MAGRNEITKSAFADILAPSASSSTPTKKVRYNVFINHRGPDTKQTLAASIYRALKLMGLEVFLDEPELDLGDSIPSEIQHAITTSFLHIAILSPRYAESTWCLEELSLMLKTGQKIIPLFYNVDVNDIRWIKGSYAQEFFKFEAKKRYRPEKLEDWKSALRRVSYLKGHILNSEECSDEEVLKLIKNDVLKKSKKIPFVVAKHPVGLDKILQDFERIVLEYSKYVKIVGITGMGGCGKTTLAKNYYYKMIQFFYRCTFVFDVGTKNLYEMQKQMFQDLGGSEDISFDSVEEGKANLTNYLSFVQVFIILDNVDHLDQLESLLPMKNSLGYDSVIVVISRDSHILEAWGIPSNSIYKMEELNSEHSMKLFCWHAFGKPSPKDGFECLVSRFLKFCRGLPLALKVLGGLVHGKSKDFWASQLDKVSKSLPRDIKSILKVSFDALDEEEEKEIFLDISCFFVGREKDSAIAVWEESGWSGECSLQTLVDKFLVEIDDENCLRMHDLLRDLGRDISKTKSPYRLWSSEQITHIEEEGKGSVQIRGIKVQTDEVYKDLVELVEGSGKRLKRKRGLKILNVEKNYFTEELAALSEGLVSLRWANFPHAAIPPWVSLKKLRVLELFEASKLEEPWRESADPPEQLKVLNINHAGNFLSFPRSIGFLKHLKEISFAGEGAPIEGLPDEFCCLQSLERLNLVGCDKLKSLPGKFGDLTNLRHLILRECSGIEGLPEDFYRLQSLERLELVGCDKLKSLPSKFGDLINLQVLYVTFSYKIESLPEDFGSLQSLKELVFRGCLKLKSLPSKFGNLKNLQKLIIEDCILFEELSEDFGGLQSLKELTLDCSSLKSLPSKFGDLTNLNELVIFRWSKLMIPCEALRQLYSLKYLYIWCCGVSRLSISPDCCPSLQQLRIRDNYGLVQIDSLPISLKELDVSECLILESISLRGLVKLQGLGVYDCESLESISLCGMVKLQSLCVDNCESLRKIEGLENCSSLEVLILDTFAKVAVIENINMMDMESLRWVNIAAECGLSAYGACLETINREV